MNNFNSLVDKKCTKLMSEVNNRKNCVGLNENSLYSLTNFSVTLNCSKKYIYLKVANYIFDKTESLKNYSITILIAKKIQIPLIMTVNI